jgi:hypothetical protein
MMQSCASAAKLRGGGPILHSGMEAVVLRRVTATSDRHWQTSMGCQCGCPVVFGANCFLMTVDAIRRLAVPRLP